VDDDPGDADPTSARQGRRPRRDTTADGSGRS